MGQENQSSKTSCHDVITKCDKALEDKKHELELSDLGLKTCQSLNGDLMREVEDSRDKLQSWTRNPFIVGALGIITGALLFGVIKK